jgi:hypothetical protein
MATLQVFLELVLVGIDHGNILLINTEFSSFVVFRRGVMRRRLYAVVVPFHLDDLVSEVTVISG